MKACGLVAAQQSSAPQTARVYLLRHGSLVTCNRTTLGFRRCFSHLLLAGTPLPSLFYRQRDAMRFGDLCS